MSTLKLFKNIQCSRQSWVIKAGARMGLPDESGGGGWNSGEESWWFWWLWCWQAGGAS